MFPSGQRKLNTNDFRCSKCSKIQHEPVVIPCAHRFCLACIDETISGNSLNCPLCRLPFDSWLRLRQTTTKATTLTPAKKLTAAAIAVAQKETLLDESLWCSIKKRFNDLLITRSAEQQSTSKLAQTHCLARPPISTAAETLVRRKLGILDKKINDINTLGDNNRGGTTDSINKEMTHFRPICLMPLSVRNTAEKIIKVPPIRQKYTKIDLTKTYKPVKSKFKQKLTSVHRRSAFCIFHPIKVPIKSTAVVAPSQITASAIFIPTVKHDSTLESSTITKTAELSKNINVNNSNKISPIACANRRKRHTNKPQNENGKLATTKETILQKAKLVPAMVPSLKKGNLREKLRLQEKEDFQFAKMLQEYENNAHSPSTNRTIRYSLRSRSKPSTSSLSSSSSSVENFQNKFTIMTTKANKKNNSNGITAVLGKSLRNGNKPVAIIDFNGPKLTRSRRLALTMTGA